MPQLNGSQTGGEMLQKGKINPERELMVYSRKKIQQKSKDLPIIMSENQSESQNEGPSNDSGNSGANVISYSPPSDLDIPIVIRKGTRTCTQRPIAKYLSYHRLSKNYRAFISNVSNLFIPRTIKEAISEPNWKLAINEEMNALKRNGTWEVVSLPRDKKIVGCKWVFIVK